MSRVCTHCGEMYPETRLNCPHCGAEPDVPWSEPGPDLDDGTMDEGSYEEFLRREGLAPEGPPRRPGGPASRTGLVLGLLTLFALAVAVWILLS